MLLTMRFLAPSVLAAVLFALVEHGRPQEALLYTPTIADPCDPRHSVLDAITHRFRSDCGVRQWCKPTAPFDRDPLLALPVLSPIASWKREEAATVAVAVHPPTASIAPSTATSVGDFGLCLDKQCRRDEFPFGYKGVPFDALPPLCSADQFCPDDESECQPLIGLGKQCQLNRDDSCERPVSTTHRTLCLAGLCRLADAGDGEACLLDSTAYIGYNESGHEVVATVTRDDCQDNLYCDEVSSLCQAEKATGSRCVENRECIEFNCHTELNMCERAPHAAHQMPAWSWGAIALAVLATLVALVWGLYQVHIRHRHRRAEEIDQFFSEQWTYRHSILSMHAAAAMASGHDAKEDQGWASGLRARRQSPSPK